MLVLDFTFETHIMAFDDNGIIDILTECHA